MDRLKVNSYLGMDEIKDMLKSDADLINRFLREDVDFIDSEIDDIGRASDILENYNQNTLPKIENILYIKELLTDADFMTSEDVNISYDLKKEMLDKIEDFISACKYLNMDIENIKEIVRDFDWIDGLNSEEE